ncbi:MAG: hypothetical protein WDA65_04110 [Christensenellales bacterium]
MKIIVVETKKQMREFVRLPYMLFSNNPNFVPPLWIDENNAYTAKNNPILKNSDFRLFMALDDNNKPVGRSVAYIDHAFNNYNNSKIGFFGAFDCIDNKKTALLLIKAIEEWLCGHGMETIRGPIHPAAENWGFVLEGCAAPPVYMSPWNPEYYHDFFDCYMKSKDLLVYEADMQNGYELPERFNGFLERFLRRNPSISIRRLNMRRIHDDAKAILDISNCSLANNWGYVPLELSVMEDMLKKLKLIVDPDAVWMVEDNGQPVGYCLGFPDINIILSRTRGRLFPFGWYKLLSGVKKLRDYRLFGLAVHPRWHGKALDALMYIHLYQNLKAKKVRMEANYILEDNLHIKNALERLGLKRTKVYRIYEKPLIDANKPA